jgi:L-alanine-DL-glutamate epimerase-like enolase superfamily enzyme
MKINNIETIAINVPLKKGLTAKTAHGEHAVSPYVLVKVHTDQGIVGLGEATISGLWSGETPGSTIAAIRDYIAPPLIGKDPRDITAARQMGKASTPVPVEAEAHALSGADLRNVQKEIAALERALTKLATKIDTKHIELAEHDQSDHIGIGKLTAQLRQLDEELAVTEGRWLELSELVESAG